jgi:restriction system protein
MTIDSAHDKHRTESNPVSEDVADRLPTSKMTATDYERAVARMTEDFCKSVPGCSVQHLEKVPAYDGVYEIDVTARFEIGGLEFLVLFECKKWSSAVKREQVQTLASKLQSTGAQKGVIVSAAGFQKGALEFAKAHKIACVRLVDEAWTYLTKDSVSPEVTPSGVYVSYEYASTEAGYESTLLTGKPEYTRECLLRGIELLSERYSDELG